MAERPGFKRQTTDKQGEVESDIALAESSSGPSATDKQAHDSKAHDGKPTNTFEIREAVGDDVLPDYDDEEDGVQKVEAPVETAKDLLTKVLHVDDDPSISPWTFRLFVLGM